MLMAAKRWTGAGLDRKRERERRLYEAEIEEATRPAGTCECGGDVPRGLSVCARCYNLDGSLAGDWGEFALIQTLRALGGSATIPAMCVEMPGARYNTIQQGLLRLQKRGRVRCEVVEAVRDTGPGNLKHGAHALNGGTEIGRWSLVDLRTDGHDAPDDSSNGDELSRSRDTEHA